MTDDIVTFTVNGEPATSGSKRAFVYKKDGRYHAAVTADNTKQKPYQALVHQLALDAMGKRKPFEGPVRLVVVIYRRRPQAHHVSSDRQKPVREHSPVWVTTKPDGLKVVRAIEDAMSGVVYHDDSQVVEHQIQKMYSERHYTVVTVQPLFE